MASEPPVPQGWVSACKNAFLATFAATAGLAKKLLKLMKGGEDDVDAEVDRMNTDLQTQANTTAPMPPADP